MSSETLAPSTPLPPEKPSARDRILSVAGPLFYREGYRAIGIDRVIAEADVAKATFYKHFPSKDDLIVAWITRAEARSSQGLPPEDGPDPLSAYVDAMIAMARQGSCMGCTYQGTAAEFAAPAHPAHAAAIGVKTRVLETLETRARAQGLTEPRATAEAVFLFLEGIWAAVRMFGPNAPLRHAETAARRLFV
jgi:AcrR family transcriptional regulator